MGSRGVTMQGMSTPGLRDRKKAETRTRIAYATVDLLVNEGAEGTTIARIAEKANISTRTFHNYFPHREAALLHMLNQFLDEMVDMVNLAEPGKKLISIAEDIAISFYNRPAASPTSIESLSRIADHLHGTPPHLRAELFGDNDRRFHSGLEFFSPLVQALQDYSYREGKELSTPNALLVVQTIMLVPGIFTALEQDGSPSTDSDVRNAFHLLANGLSELG